MRISADESEQFDACLIGFQNHDPQSANDFWSVVRPYILRLARNIARPLPADLQEEVASQTCLNLLGNSKLKFNPRRGSAKMFLVLAVRNAYRQVRAQNCPPGQITRTRRKCIDEKEEEQQEVVSHLDDLESSLSDNRTEKQIEARCDACSLLGLASPQVAVALHKVFFHGNTLNEAAEELNVSRFKLRREIAAYTMQMQQLIHAPAN